MNGYKIVYQFKGMTEIRKSAAKKPSQHITG